MEVNKRNPTKRPYRILSYNLLIRIYGENPRKGNRERAIENIRKKSFLYFE